MLHEERERRKRAQAARRASKDLGEFTRQAWREVLWPTIPLEWNWHHEALCAHLQAAGEAWARGQLAALEEWDAEMEERAERLRYGRGEPVEQHLLQQLFNVPPGTAKSTIISVTFHAWMWQLWPEWSLLALSANPDVAGRDAEFARNIIQHEWYQDTFSPDWAIRKSEDAKSYYRNTRGGFRRSKGMTAKATGGRAHCLLFDDPHDAEEAKSDTMREAVLSRWDTAWSSRVNDERVSLRIGIMQRLQEKDLSGHWLAQGGVRHVCFPLEYEPKRGCRCPDCLSGKTPVPFLNPATRRLCEGDPRTVEGEVIHPARFPPQVVAALKKKWGSYGYAGQAQQRPAPASGGMFPRKWWRWHSEGGVVPTRNGAPVARPEGCWEGPPVPTPVTRARRIISVDANFKETTDSDPAALWVIDTVGAGRYVRQRVTAHGFPDTLRAIQELVAAWSPDGVVIENKANGAAIISTLRQKVSGVVEWEPGQDSKPARAANMQPSVEAGDWLLPDGADWVDEVVGQFATFPRGAHDDDVDAGSQAHAYLNQPPFFFIG